MRSPVTEQRTKVSTIDAVAHCTEFAAAQAESAGFSGPRLRELELVVEEIVANICRYSYGDQLGNVELICRLLEGPKLELEFVDYGQPFDILTLPPPDLAVDIDQRDVGGVGVPMLRALVDRASYRRETDRNILCVIIGATPKLGGGAELG
jgi:serine/threonine-protein kinase RsbW